MQDRSTSVSWTLAIALHAILLVWVGYNFEPKTLQPKLERLVAKTIVLDQEIIAMVEPLRIPPPEKIETAPKPQPEPEPEIVPPEPEPEPEPLPTPEPEPVPEPQPVEEVVKAEPVPEPEPVKETPPPKPEPKKTEAKPAKPKPKPKEKEKPKPKPKPKKQEPKPKPKEKPKPKPVEKPKPKPEPKKEQPKPAPKKEEPKEPPKPQVSEKQKALMAKAKQSIAKVEGAKIEKGSVPVVKPAKLGVLNIESAGPPSYQRALASKLRSLLTLPEFGDVRLKLTLNRTGKVLKIEVLSAKSKRNQSYIEQTLHSATMPPFGENFAGSDQQTFTLTLTSE